MAPHAVIIPYPVQGHINPLIRLSEKLASHGIIITFVNTDFNHCKMMKARNRHGILQDPSFNIRFVQVTDGLPFDFKRTAVSVEFFNALMTTMRASAEDLLDKLLIQSCEPPVSCVIGSSFLPWTIDIAKKFELPFVAFWSQAVSVQVIYRHLSMIIDNGDFPPKKQGMIDYIPGLPPMHPQDLPSDIQSGDPSNPVHQVIVQQLPALEEAAWIISNTVYELERQASNVTKEKSPVFLSIGPLIPSIYFEGEGKLEDFSIASPRSLSLWAESNCLPWLDSRPERSVCYVSFGSLAQISRVQVQEIARGLMESEQAFLWVIRPDLVSSEAGKTTSIDYIDILPGGFLEKTKDRGLLVPWSPQLLVLSHPSVGGFFTHGGWNSTVESLSLGVPMLVFPQGIEQSTNRMLVVNQWKIGLRLDSCRDDAVIEGAEIAKCVKALLKDEEMRKRSNQVRDTIMKAVGEGGSSWKNMNDFVDYLMSLPTKKMHLSRGSKR
ncbi:hypothetical protein SUGI_0487360 [Cryptomeria japonica]|uniref:UDP-glycosyltransferase 86A1 n=1 Tax=Cryptomeria japonica TaxID=3369 RepID=UPI002408E151|nr:UDP-glycosyltransferase 86A1 [Cryptomeria japonica]GLJ25454.1 hypothetical protein SUGI_0487360 [Cryptomeria japonica]